MKDIKRANLRRLSESVAEQNTKISYVIDKVVATAANSNAAERTDSVELQKTSDLLVMNSLILGETLACEGQG